MGLSPVHKMDTEFYRVVEHRKYRLRNPHKDFTRRESLGMYLLKIPVDGLQPAMEVFDGLQPIGILVLL